MTSTSYDAVVLAGGRSRRMGGGDKTRLPVDGLTLLDRVLAALPTDTGVVVVGEERDTVRAVTWAREEPPLSGPAAAIEAGLRHVQRDTLLLLAGDLPFLTADFLDRLVASTQPGAGAVPVDADDVPQWLCSAWPTELLRTAAWSTDASMRAVLGALPFTRVALDAGTVPPWLDCDTPEDLRRARELA